MMRVLERRGDQEVALPVLRAARRPIAALVLAGASRLVLLAVVTVLGALLVTSRTSDMPADAQVRADVLEGDAADGPQGGSGPGLGATVGVSVAPSDLVAGLLSGVAGSGATLQSVSLTRTQRATDLRLSVIAQDHDPSTIVAVLATLVDAGVLGPTVRSVVPAAGGPRLEVVGRVDVTTARTAEVAPREAGNVVVGITRLVADAGATLERLEVPSGPEGTIRLHARGDAGALVAVVGAIELVHSSPRRISDLRLDRSAEDRFDVVLGFGLRPPTAGGR